MRFLRKPSNCGIDAKREILPLGQGMMVGRKEQTALDKALPDRL